MVRKIIVSDEFARDAEELKRFLGNKIGTRVSIGDAIDIERFIKERKGRKREGLDFHI